MMVSNGLVWYGMVVNHIVCGMCVVVVFVCVCMLLTFRLFVYVVWLVLVCSCLFVACCVVLFFVFGFC